MHRRQRLALGPGYEATGETTIDQSRLRHLYVPSPIPDAGEVRLEGALRHRICNVLRLRPGQAIILRSPAGDSALAEISSLTTSAAILGIVRRVAPPPPPPARIIVAQAVGKGDRFERVLQHGTELGVSAFIPLETGRTVKKVPPARRDDRHARWQRIVEAAAEQSQRDRVPAVWQTMRITQSLEATADCPLRYLLDPDGDLPISADAGTVSGHSVALFVGPEGGFDRTEIETLRAAGAVSRTLGPYVLRTETAALAAVSILLWSR